MAPIRPGLMAACLVAVVVYGLRATTAEPPETPPPLDGLEIVPIVPGAEPKLPGKERPSEDNGFGGRNPPAREVTVRAGTKRTERTITGALLWLARHQLGDGRWSLQHSERCGDKTCTGPATMKADAAATAMGLLPFLGAGQTQQTKGPYQRHVQAGIAWLMRQQKVDGDLAAGAPQKMYSHGLATIALCEVYGLTKDKVVGQTAQNAVNFIIRAQNKTTGGWRYNPGDTGDTSVLGWQLSALKSAKLAGLEVGQDAFDGVGKWLDTVAKGPNGSQFSYTPDSGATPTMTAVGLLARQCLGAKRDSAMMAEGIKYLLNHQPENNIPNVYYWYYATQAVHNGADHEWDNWHHTLRPLLVASQNTQTGTCANGSWSPEKDVWGRHGGRLMTTSFSTLCMEVYYRYLPLYKPLEPAEQTKPRSEPAEKAGQ